MNRIPPEGPNLEPTACPYCHEKIDCSTGVLKDMPPSPGDISICLYCGEPSKFDDQLQMVKLESSELADVMSDPVVRTSMLHIKARKAAANPDRQKAYTGQLEKMASDVAEWRVNHRDSRPEIQYNFQANTGVVAALQDAIDHHFISVNEDALIMFKELGWLDNKPTMPTVMMVRVVLEHVFGKEE